MKFNFIISATVGQAFYKYEYMNKKVLQKSFLCPLRKRFSFNFKRCGLNFFKILFRRLV